MTKKSLRVPLLVLAIAIAAAAAVLIREADPPLLRQYAQQLRDRLRALRGRWGDGSTRFVDVAGAAGLRYRWRIAGPRPIDILQGIGNGCAFLDYDADGSLDVLLVGPRLALFRGDGRGHFTDVTRAAGLAAPRGHFLGCAVGDYDNDGFDDVYVSGYRAGLLLHNDGGKGFTDVTRAAGLAPQPWGTSCAWADVDGDGRLDLFVGNYVRFDARTDGRLCPTPAGPSGCGPQSYPALHGVLYRNDGGRRFRDATQAWAGGQTSGKVLGAAFGDGDGSGRPSLYLADDLMPGDLLQSRGGRMRNVGVKAGVSATDGHANAGMGVDWGDYDNDGLPDLAVGAFALQPKPIYHNVGRGAFEEASSSLGFRGPSERPLTFGAKWLDYDNDGWLDLMMASGHVRDNAVKYRADATFLQPTLLFHNAQGRRLEDRSQDAGPDVARPILGRGLAVGDYDNDGRVDALVVDSEGAPLLLHNEGRETGHWLSLKLVGVKSNRDGYGARVTAQAGGLTQTRWCHSDGSYLSASDKRVHLGLGAARVVETLAVRWPGGHTDTLRRVKADQELTVREGASP